MTGNCCSATLVLVTITEYWPIATTGARNTDCSLKTSLPAVKKIYRKYTCCPLSNTK